MIALNAPKRPALRYYGGKWRAASWIVSHFPAHRAYLEPTCGGASVFLCKPPAEVETLNDANGRVINFFRQLRDNADELIRRIDLTPWAEDEYRGCRTPSDDPVEDARRFYVTSWQSVHGVGDLHSGWRWMIDPDGRRGLSPAVDWIAHDLATVAARLRRAHIVNRDALAIIRRMLGVSECLIYFDPPYTVDQRTRKNGYGEYEVTKDWHIETAALLNQHAGPVVVSGYRSPLYDGLYDGWRRVERSFQANSGAIRVESLWLNPAALRPLESEQLPLFGVQP